MVFIGFHNPDNTPPHIIVLIICKIEMLWKLKII